MDRITSSSKQVKEIRQDGIVYLDDNGVEQFIDFEGCYQNYLAWHLSPEAIESFKRGNNKTDADVPEHIERTKKWKEVAARNVIETFFQFYTTPPVRIKFESEDEWWEMRNKIEHEFRWRTFDVT